MRMVRGCGSLRGDHIVIDRLTPGQQSDLGAGAGGGEDLQSGLGLGLADVLAVEDGDELGLLLGLRPGQALEQGGQVLVGAE